MKMTLMIVALWAVATVAFAAGTPQTHCPVMTDNAIDHNSPHVDVDGYRIYVCCGGCVGAVEADPAQYIEKMKAEGVEIEKTPSKEPAAVE